MGEFDHEKMDVYRRALDFIRTASSIRDTLLGGRATLADQLDRAAVSIALNVAEGAGEFARREKARFYRIARRSANRMCRHFSTSRWSSISLRRSASPAGRTNCRKSSEI